MRVKDIRHSLRGPDAAVLVVEVPRELNHDSAEPLRAAVLAALPNRDGAALVLDMSAVVLISSIGIAALLQILEFGRDRRAPVLLAAVSARQMTFFKMLKLDQKFGFAPTVDDSVSRINAS